MSQPQQQQFVQDNLELDPTWSAKVGPSYNPIPSTEYETTLLSNGVREFTHQAPAEGGWLSGLNDQPIPAGFTAGLVKHRGIFMFDSSIINGGSRIVLEFDNRIADGLGNNNNFSNQINLSQGGLWQTDPQTGKWTTTGNIVPISPLVWHDIEFTNFIDLDNIKLSFLTLNVDGKIYTAPVSMQGLTPMRDADGHWWKRGSNLQVQMCRETAGSASCWARGIRTTWLPQ